jgi:diamine N-acetyltransferase
LNGLENDLIRLRAIEPADVDVIYKWENDVSIWRVSNTITPFSKNLIRQYIKNAHLDIYQTKQLRLMIELKAGNDIATPIGTVDLFNFDPYHLRAGVGILISEPENRQKGYAFSAINLMIKYAFDILGLHQLFCNISEDNKASLKLFDKAGFRIIGNKNDWLKTGKNKWKGEYLLQLINK